MTDTKRFQSLADFLHILKGVKGNGTQYSAQCPAHDDTHNSLSVALKDNGKIVLNCHKGCTAESICDAMGIQIKDLFLENRSDYAPALNDARGAHKASQNQSYQKEPSAIYEYGNGLQKLRFDGPGGKRMTWRRSDGKGGYVTHDTRSPGERLLYTGGDPISPDSTVFLVEGEKDVDSLVRLGFCAASGPDGAGPGKFKNKADYEQLAGCIVGIIPDNDAPGRDLAQEAFETVLPVAKTAFLLDLSQAWPEIPEKGDVSDMISALGEEKTAELLYDLLNKAYQNARPKPSAKPLRAINGENLPPLRPPLIDGVIRDKALLMFSGPSKLGKTHAMIQLGLAVATGGKWFGHNCKKGRVLFVDFEVAEDEISHTIQETWKKKGIPFEAVADQFLYLGLRGYNFSRADAINLIIETIRGTPVSLVIVDPVYCLLEGNENDAGDVKEIMTDLRRVCEEGKCALVFTHHHSKGGQSQKTAADRGSGSGVWARGVDALIDMLELEVVDSVRDEAIRQNSLPSDSLVTGLRLEYVVRSFKTPEPRTAFFSHPLHYLDTGNLLSTARSAVEAYSSRVKSLNSRNRIDGYEILDRAYDYCEGASKDGKVTYSSWLTAVNNIATQENGRPYSESTVKKYAEGHYTITRKKQGSPSYVEPLF